EPSLPQRRHFPVTWGWSARLPNRRASVREARRGRLTGRREVGFPARPETTAMVRLDGPARPPRGGGAAGGVFGTPLLTRDEERDLARRSAAGDATAEERLIISHLRVVVRLARSYGRFGLPINDLVQEGTLGLIQAVRRFNPERDVRLSTYAMWWIRAAMQEHVVRSWSLVRVGK